MYPQLTPLSWCAFCFSPFPPQYLHIWSDIETRYYLAGFIYSPGAWSLGDKWESNFYSSRPGAGARCRVAERFVRVRVAGSSRHMMMMNWRHIPRMKLSHFCNNDELLGDVNLLEQGSLKLFCEGQSPRICCILNGNVEKTINLMLLENSIDAKHKEVFE